MSYFNREQPLRCFASICIIYNTIVFVVLSQSLEILIPAPKMSGCFCYVGLEKLRKGGGFFFLIGIRKAIADHKKTCTGGSYLPA